MVICTTVDEGVASPILKRVGFADRLMKKDTGTLTQKAPTKPWAMTKVVFPQPSFSMYKIYAKAAESDGVPFDLDEEFNLDVDEFVKKVRDVNASLAVICNPNNPTGNALTPAQVEKIAASIDCAFLLDEAYVEFYGRSAVNLVAKYPN